MALELMKGVLPTVGKLSVIETCRLRQLNPWAYISSVIKLARSRIESSPTSEWSSYLNLNCH